MLRNLWNDEVGAVVSAELVLVITIVVIGMIVGLSELAYGVAHELNDVGDAIGSLNQSYEFRGFQSTSDDGSTLRAAYHGSVFVDLADASDNNDITSNIPPRPEATRF